MEIIGYEGLYYIEPNGDIYSQDRIDTNNHFCQGQKIITQLKRDGYYQVKLSKNGTRNFFLVHRLVALTYIPNPYNYPCVNHKDCNKQNNNINNLEWCTIMYNNQSINSSRKFGHINLSKWNTYRTRYNSNGKTYCKNFKTEKEARDYLNNEERKLINEK
jgi:hypothetical protein